VLYEAIRGEVLDIHRDRPISERHAELGMFAFDNRRGMTWAETLQLWNELNTDRPDSKEWTYDAEAPFVRDARQAFRRITGNHLEWEGKPSPSGHGQATSMGLEGPRKKLPKTAADNGSKGLKRKGNGSP
jgi:hypothetical protein